MLGDNMEQGSGDNSTNFQVRGNLTVGLSYDDAKQIALDVFKANFYDFSERAAQKATERAEEMTEKFISKFFSEIPQHKNKLEEPAIQSSMFNAQKEYAKTGDTELESRLLDLLVERINSDERSLKQIVLDEALLVLPKLTNEQVDVLTLIFSALNSHRLDILNLPSLEDFINNKLIKFYPENIDTHSFFTHLQFSGCCTLLSEGAKYKPFEEIYLSRFKGLFNKGFTEQEFKNEVDTEIGKYRDLFLQCLQNPIAIQLNSLTDSVLEDQIKVHKLDESKDKLMQLWNRTTMTQEEVKQYLIRVNSKFEKFLSDWKDKDLKTIRLTSVGYAIAIMNFNKHTGENINLHSYL